MDKNSLGERMNLSELIYAEHTDLVFNALLSEEECQSEYQSVKHWWSISPQLGHELASKSIAGIYILEHTYGTWLGLTEETRDVERAVKRLFI
ncbi:hypothetical protein [Spartinivicinus poritis]|uniref:Uncharacterized protein n=1 Tax=Spartinivicinus poritis TaxID=2994640 RepID=A0ABT5U703_9GAMM|nr:hypothetical protein [Spartinivicinus sp. A2-2]MDE1462092.1 hypothetical protein [Spartinivicinus sp. A2-2]